ncbi:MAG: reverse transcriptase family protein [Usitatibacter sp.]
MANAILAGPNGPEEFTARLASALGRKHRWVAPLSRRIFERFGSRLGHPMRSSLIEFIEADAAFQDAWGGRVKPRIGRYFLDSPPMEPRKGTLAACALPALATPGDLAHWLRIGITELDWFADPRQLNGRTDGRLSHYHYRWIEKREGYRLIESPKPRLREIQRKILREIIQVVPAHRGAHGFVRGRSCLTYARPHVGKLMVLRMDLRNFFASVPDARVNALFKMLGYPEATARLLAGICTNSPPRRILQAIPSDGQRYQLPMRERAQLERRHLPQGAPTSPALANLCALHLDMRIDGLARAMECDYSRYADDIAISGNEELRRRVDKLSTLIAAIALEEGFEVNHRKTRAMHQSHRQVLTGIVVNQKLNLRRASYDELKAILHNCGRHGAPSQNRGGHDDFRAHIAGRIEYLRNLNPGKGEKLQAAFDRTVWR